MFWPNQINLTRQSQRTNSYSKRSLSDRYSQLNDLPTKLELKNNQFQRNSKQKSFKQKVQKFISVNKRHDLDQVCVCQDCIYAKQLGKYQILKMDLSKGSTYKSEYNKHLLKRNLNNINNTLDLSTSTVSRKTIDSLILRAKNIHSGSNYNNQFASKSLEKIQKPRPEDQLKFKGPTYSYSSYKAQYPKHQGPSQYVEPLPQEKMPSLKFYPGSLYADSYKNMNIVKTSTQKIPDQLRLGKAFLVNQSSNKSQYNTPNPELSLIYNQRQKNLPEKRIQTPNFSFQFKTINTNEYSEPVLKKNCRNKRLQYLHGQLLTSGDYSLFN